MVWHDAVAKYLDFIFRKAPQNLLSSLSFPYLIHLLLEVLTFLFRLFSNWIWSSCRSVPYFRRPDWIWRVYYWRVLRFLHSIFLRPFHWLETPEALHGLHEINLDQISLQHFLRFDRLCLLQWVALHYCGQHIHGLFNNQPFPMYWRTWRPISQRNQVKCKKCSNKSLNSPR